MRAARAQRGLDAALIATLAAILAAVVSPAHGDSVEDFNKGRTITVLIGYSPGGSYDSAGGVLDHYIGSDRTLPLVKGI